jgi:phenol 2-monooxygenase
MIIGEAAHQELADGFPIGKRFKSVRVRRVADTNPIHLGHHARADGRWRIYAFADVDGAGLAQWAEWLATSPESPVVRYTPEGTDPDRAFDVKAIYQQDHSEVDLGQVPDTFLPRVGPFELIDYEKVYAADPEHDIFDLRGIDRSGAVVVVRPDQYVAHVLPLDATAELAAFFAQNMVARKVQPAAV